MARISSKTVTNPFEEIGGISDSLPPLKGVCPPPKDLLNHDEINPTKKLMKEGKDDFLGMRHRLEHRLMEHSQLFEKFLLEQKNQTKDLAEAAIQKVEARLERLLSIASENTKANFHQVNLELERLDGRFAKIKEWESRVASAETQVAETSEANFRTMSEMQRQIDAMIKVMEANHATFVRNQEVARQDDEMRCRQYEEYLNEKTREFALLATEAGAKATANVAEALLKVKSEDQELAKSTADRLDAFHQQLLHCRKECHQIAGARCEEVERRQAVATAELQAIRDDIEARENKWRARLPTVPDLKEMLLNTEGIAIDLNKETQQKVQLLSESMDKLLMNLRIEGSDSVGELDKKYADCTRSISNEIDMMRSRIEAQDDAQAARVQQALRNSKLQLDTAILKVQEFVMGRIETLQKEFRELNRKTS